MVMIPVGDYTPDQPDYLNAGITTGSNTYPRDGQTDGPLKGPFTTATGLSATAYGAAAFKATDGTSYVYAGVGTNLYVQNGMSWNAIGGASAPYAPVEWRFARFGDLVIATDLVDAVQAHTLGSGGNFAPLGGSPPKAAYVATFEPGFVMLGAYNDGTYYPNGLRWSGIGSATNWPTPGGASAAAAQSDFQLLQTGGEITGLLPGVGGAAGVVFTESTLYRVEYVGSPTVFAFRLIDDRKGNIARNGAVQVNGVAYYLSEDGFCSFDGQQVRQIGFEKIDTTFFSLVARDKLRNVWGAVDYERKCVVWAFPAGGATVPNRWLMYNYAAGRWRLADAPEVTTQLLFSGLSAGYTIDTIDTVLPVGGPDASTVSFDDPLFAGGARSLLGFQSNQLVSFSGSTIAARFDTGEADASGRRVLVTAIRALTNATTYYASTGTREDFDDAISYTSPTQPGSDKRAPQRVTGRYARASVLIPAGVEWTYFQGIDVTMRAEGYR